MKAASALILFARAPAPGTTKTRLIPAIGREGAADLYRCFLLDTLERAATTEAAVMVFVAEAAEAPALEPLLGETCPKAAIFVQTGADLGARMLNAFRQALVYGHRQVVIMGSDIPSLPWDRVTQALASDRDLVLGPCLDGGYYLIGLHDVYPDLFLNMRWSVPNVCADTLTRARKLSLSAALLDPWYDVDLPPDLATLSRHLTALALAGQNLPCPRTHHYLEALQRAGWHV